MGDDRWGADRRSVTRFRLHNGGPRTDPIWLLETRSNELQGDRGKWCGEGMRELRDLAMVVSRTGQVGRTMLSKDELCEQHHHRHSNGNAVPAQPQLI
ncbi:hypothetical protein [Nitrococcus mobilis]|uniref:Uncharacterized protein n=1 Tax=Nitrococcus mobilis Nb-231 TaxID=314278 RepID=A4BUQ9_9GAMM|nr:hypothetical protein [Nitrococcus mobilis]EAR20513.1 hypothetical protein NB231_01643 [Nitrococcus mobilis Nb-231]